MPRPSGTRPQLLLWKQEAGSDEKRYLAETAMKLAFIPKTLASRVGMDQRDLGRWFKRSGNGDGRILQGIARALNLKVWEVRASVAPANFSIEDLAAIERQLIDDVRANGERYPDARALSKTVREKLKSCLADTRRKVLTQYARDREQQRLQWNASLGDLRNAAAAIGTEQYSALATAVREPEHPLVASDKAIDLLSGLTGFQVPLAPEPAPIELARELFAHARQLKQFKHYRTGRQVFSEAQILASIESVLKELSNNGWPQEKLDEALRFYKKHYREDAP